MKKQNKTTEHLILTKTYKNVDSKGNIRKGVDRKKTHTPTYKEVKNIETGKAINYNENI